MPFRVPPSRVAAALDFIGRLRNQAAEFGGGVVSNLADRARAAGGLAYEALTTDPNIGRMTTAEFSQAAADRAPTPGLDQAARDIGTIGRAIATQPVETGKAIVGGEIDRFKGAFASPQAAGEYAGSFIDPLRLAAALRHRIPISELDVYHGTPHTYAPTEANPLGEFDASKIGTGEGAQAYGHGIYLAERPELAEYYRKALTPPTDINDWSAGSLQIKKRGDYLDYSPKSNSAMDEARAILTENLLIDENTIRNAFDEGGIEKARAVMLGVADHTAEVRPDLKPYLGVLRKNLNEKLVFNATKNQGAILKADLPDEMIDRMLDWDKPLSEQSDAVKTLLRKQGITGRSYEVQAIGDGPEGYLNTRFVFDSPFKARAELNKLRQQGYFARPYRDGMGKGKTGAEFAQELTDPVQNAERLRSMGIPGIRYLDAGSRGQGGSETRNFVVFPGEEKKVRILERNGQPAPERIAQALEAAPTETPSSLVMPFTERKTAAGRAALKNLHKEQGVTYKDWSFERGGAHTPAGPNSGSPAFDVTLNGTYPDDFYGVNGLRYYGTGYDALDVETYMSLQKLAGRPNHPITVYRAVEKDAKGKINPGDWVTTSRAYAKEHGQSALGGNFKIVKSTVYAKDIWTSGDSMLEWGYHPQGKVPEIKWR